MRGKHIFVEGKVQGVGFRFHTCTKAKELQLKGWVRNLPDGRVEVAVTGDNASMQTFLEWLSHGPPRAEVKKLLVEDRDFSDNQFDSISEFVIL